MGCLNGVYFLNVLYELKLDRPIKLNTREIKTFKLCLVSLGTSDLPREPKALFQGGGFIPNRVIIDFCSEVPSFSSLQHGVRQETVDDVVESSEQN